MKGSLTLFQSSLSLQMLNVVKVVLGNCVLHKGELKTYDKARCVNLSLTFDKIMQN